jgi:tetratricopeptide (TPR) repeat protein
VARYLVAAGLADDPEQGYAYAQAAKRLAARVGVVREACGIAAYQTGRWAEALSEFRAARRMTGRDDYLPVMADCERALGRLDRALALVREGSTAHLDRATQIELRIVESGIRRDQGLSDAAVLALQVPELTSGRLRPWSARLFYAYADALLAAGRADEARDAFARAAEADPDGETDAADRLDQLDGIEFDDLEDDDLEADNLEDDDLEDESPDDADLDDGDEKGDLQDVDLQDVDLQDADLQADDLELDDLDDDNAEGDFGGGIADEKQAREGDTGAEDAGESNPAASQPG